MDTQPLDQLTFLELENLSLKLHVLKLQTAASEKTFLDAANKAFDLAGLTPALYALDLDRGIFVKKALPEAKE